jgi:hypothetical protein
MIETGHNSNLLPPSFIDMALGNRTSNGDYRDMDVIAHIDYVADFVRNNRYDAIEKHEMLLVDDDTFFGEK